MKRLFAVLATVFISISAFAGGDIVGTWKTIDDETGKEKSHVQIWQKDGVYYAKVVKLSAENEPEIYSATRRFGTILENVGFDIDTRQVDLNDVSLTENTRAAYRNNGLYSQDHSKQCSNTFTTPETGKHREYVTGHCSQSQADHKIGAFQFILHVKRDERI